MQRRHRLTAVAKSTRVSSRWSDRNSWTWCSSLSLVMLSTP